jgi:hypothetical protein
MPYARFRPVWLQKPSSKYGIKWLVSDSVVNISFTLPFALLVVWEEPILHLEDCSSHRLGSALGHDLQSQLNSATLRFATLSQVRCVL